VDDLKNIKGFGDKNLAKLKGELTVTGGEAKK
jgi:DNA uptake protein ComE-like DNA-binding protein